jgi:hypothetical protein
MASLQFKKKLFAIFHTRLDLFEKKLLGLYAVLKIIMASGVRNKNEDFSFSHLKPISYYQYLLIVVFEGGTGTVLSYHPQRQTNLSSLRHTSSSYSTALYIFSSSTI